MKNWFLFICAFSLWSFVQATTLAGDKIDFTHFEVQGQNRTEDFRSNWKDACASFIAKTSQFQRYKILFVPGFFSNVVLSLKKLGKIARKQRLGEQFDEPIEYLKRQGFDVMRVAIGSEDTPEANAAKILAEIQKANKQVILISHSKGGIDVLEALRQNHSNVYGWITIQSPFWGSPVADYVSAHRTLGNFSTALMRTLGGTQKAVQSLQTDVRSDYNILHQAEIADLLAAVPTLNFGSWKQNEPGRIDSMLEPFRNWMADAGIENDGLVPRKSAVLKGADYVLVEGVDHAATVMYTPLLPYERIRLIQTMLLMLEQKIQNPVH